MFLRFSVSRLQTSFFIGICFSFTLHRDAVTPVFITFPPFIILYIAVLSSLSSQVVVHIDVYLSHFTYREMNICILALFNSPTAFIADNSAEFNTFLHQRGINIIFFMEVCNTVRNQKTEREHHVRFPHDSDYIVFKQIH